MKKCPYCAEEIQDAAILCRYCNSKLPALKRGNKTPVKRKATILKRKLSINSKNNIKNLDKQPSVSSSKKIKIIIQLTINFLLYFLLFFLVGMWVNSFFYLFHYSLGFFGIIKFITLDPSNEIFFLLCTTVLPISLVLYGYIKILRKRFNEKYIFGIFLIIFGIFNFFFYPNSDSILLIIPTIIFSMLGVLIINKNLKKTNQLIKNSLPDLKESFLNINDEKLEKPTSKINELLDDDIEELINQRRELTQLNKIYNCPKCGVSITDANYICPNCGEQLSE